MKYRFKVEQCENCLLDLTGVEPEDVAGRGGQLTGYCPKCYVVYPVAKTSAAQAAKAAKPEAEPEVQPEAPES